MSNETDGRDTTGELPPGAPRTAYRMFLRGMDPERIAEELGAPAATVAVWVAERAARGNAPADALRELKRHLWAYLERTDVRDKPKFVSALSGLESKLVQWDGKCGARTRPGNYCQRPPDKGRTRCRFHGGDSLYGQDHPGFVHGGRSKYPIPLSPEEAERYKDYLKNPYDLTPQQAMAKIQYERAIERGESGARELSALARVAQVHSAITRGVTVVHKADEAQITMLADAIMGAVERGVVSGVQEVIGKVVDQAFALRMRALIALEVRALDWSTLAQPDQVAIPANASVIDAGKGP